MHYRYAIDHEIAETPAIRLGSIVHGIILGSQHAFVVYEGERRGKAWAEFKKDHSETRIITRDEHNRGIDIARAILACPDVKPLLAGAKKERRVEWQIAGRACAGTPDFVNSHLTELKITACAKPERLPYQAQRMGWLGQLRWYQSGLERAYGQAPEELFIIAAEPRPPHPVVVYQLTDGARDVGTRTWRLDWEQLMVCEASDHFPGYVQGVVPLEVQDGEDVALLVDGNEIEL